MGRILAIKQLFARGFTWAICSRMAICVAVLASSCSSTRPPHINVTKHQLSNFRKVALRISAKDLDVGQSKQPGISGPTAFAAAAAGFVGLLPAFIAFGVEIITESNADKRLTLNLREALGPHNVEKAIGDRFIHEMRARNTLSLSYSGSKPSKELPGEGYDSIIELELEELLLVGNKDKFKLLMTTSGRMIDLRNGDVIWRRSESVINNEECSLDEFKSNECKLLRDVLNESCQKMAYKLALNIIYSE